MRTGGSRSTARRASGLLPLRSWRASRPERMSLNSQSTCGTPSPPKWPRARSAKPVPPDWPAPVTSNCGRQVYRGRGRLATVAPGFHEEALDEGGFGSAFVEEVAGSPGAEAGEQAADSGLASKASNSALHWARRKVSSKRGWAGMDLGSKLAKDEMIQHRREGKRRGKIGLTKPEHRIGGQRRRVWLSLLAEKGQEIA
jgi:hypothetical protein